MMTLIAFLLGVATAAMTAFIAGALPHPWNAVQPALPLILLVSVIGQREFPLRYAACTGALIALAFPTGSWSTVAIFVMLALSIGPLFRLSFSLPTSGALLMTAIVGSALFEVLSALVRLRFFIENGFPNLQEWGSAALARLLATIVIMLLCGELYRRIFLRLRQAFLGIRSVV